MQLTTFHIDDEEAFTLFTKHLVMEPSFTWHVNCTEVHVKAFNFLPVYKLLVMQKDIGIKGLDNFPEIKLIDVQLPGTDPKGGIQISATATMSNPSPFGMQIGTLVMGLYLKDLFLGPVKATGVNLTAGNNLLVLDGHINSQANNAAALDQLGGLFTNYINSIPSTITAKGVSATQADGKVVRWLDQGISSLSASIDFVPPKPIDPIKDIAIKSVNLAFDKDHPFSPVISSDALEGSISLPFGFSVNITKVATQMTILYKGASVASVAGSYTDSSTHIKVQSSQQTFGRLHLTLPPNPMSLPNATDAAKNGFIQFEKALV